MRAILFPLLFCIVGLSLGAGAGWFLRSDDHSDAAPEEKVTAKPVEEKAEPEKADTASMEEYADGNSEFVKLNNQFVVPVVSDQIVRSLVLMSLSLEVEVGMRAKVYEREPKLRDALLQVMFDHANIGGFDGSFTDANNLDILRVALTDAARGVMKGVIYGVLIVDIARQDI